MVIVTTFRDVRFDFDPRTLAFREVQLQGSRYASRAELMEAANLVADGRVEPVFTRIVRLRGLLGVHEDLAAGSLIGRGAVD